MDGSSIVQKKNGHHYLILKILQSSGKPMDSAEILSQIKKTSKITIKNPKPAIRAILQRSMYIEKTRTRGFYQLKQSAKIPKL
jgi:hypothetical protein